MREAVGTPAPALCFFYSAAISLIMAARLQEIKKIKAARADTYCMP